MMFALARRALMELLLISSGAGPSSTNLLKPFVTSINSSFLSWNLKEPRAQD